MTRGSAGRASRAALAGLTALILASRTGAPAAADRGWFGGAGVGASAWRHYALASEASHLDDSDRVGLLLAGYQFTRNVAVRAEAVDLGRLEASGGAFGGFEESLEAVGFSLSLTGIVPVHDRVDLIGSLGAFRWRHKARYADHQGPFNPGPIRRRAWGTGPTYGIGVRYFLSPRRTWSVGADWNRYLDVGDEKESLRSNDVDLFTAGFVYRLTR